MVNNYIGIERIIEKINRFKIPGGYWNLEELKEWTYDALDAINDKNSKIKSIKDIEIINNKGKIPVEVETIESVFNSNTGQRLQEVLPDRNLDETTYLINGGYIYTELSGNKNKLTIHYYSVPLDENGSPLIPDNRYYISAIEAYIQFMIGKRSFWSGKILQGQFVMLEQEWLFYLPAAQASQKMGIMSDPDRFARIHNKFLF